MSYRAGSPPNSVMRCYKLIFFESIGKGGGGGVVGAIDICELDVTIFLEFTGP